MSQNFHLPMNSSDKEDQVPIDLGAVDKFINVTGVYSLSIHQTSCTYAITCCKNKQLCKNMQSIYMDSLYK